MNIVIVDDSLSALYLVKETLENADLGFERVMIAESARAAKQIFAAEHVDILLCDIEMPGQDGLSLIRELKDGGSDAICVILTAHASFDYAREALQLGCFDYLLKPFTLEGLLDKIRRAISQYEETKKKGEAAPPFFGMPKEPEEEPAGKSQEVELAKNYIRDNYTQNISLKDIADSVHLSPNHLILLFRREEQTTPMQYLTKVRISQAKLLLLNSRFSISQIALMTGFSNIPYFTSIFHKFTGCTPSVYRKRAGSQA